MSVAAPKQPEQTHTRGFPVALFEGILPYQTQHARRATSSPAITLAALAIPEVMGYTQIAGTPVITGLYTILIPAIAFAIFGSSRHLVVGGDSATAAILYAGIAGLGVSGLQPNSSEWLAYASLAALITAGLLMLARVARLGFLADFISRTVLIGFLTGVGIQVALGQFDGMLGVPAPDVEVDQVSGTVVKFWDTLGEIPDASLTTVAVTVGVIATLLVFERWIKAIPGGLVAVVGAIAISWGFDLESHGVSVLGSVPSGLPVHRSAEWGRLERRGAAARDLGVDGARDPRAERSDVARLRHRVPGALRREQRPRRAERGERGGRAQRHVPGQRQPDQDGDGRRGAQQDAGRDDRDGDHRRRSSCSSSPSRCSTCRTPCSRRSSSSSGSSS